MSDNKEIKTIIDHQIFQNMIEDQVSNLIIRHPSWHHVIENAKKEGWLGETWQRDKFGLLGYFRTNFAVQLKILNKLGNPVAIYDNELVSFFKSKWFSEQVLKNNYVSNQLYNNNHLEKLKNFKY